MTRKTKTAKKAVAVAKPKTQALAPVKDNKPKTVLEAIFQASQLPNINPDSMRQLLDMQKEVMAEEARLEFIAAFQALKKEMPIINRDGRIEILEKGNDGKRIAGRDAVQQSTPYATFENIMSKIEPIMDRHNFILNFETEPSADGSRILVKGVLTHGRGHVITTTFPLPAETSGSKNNVQGWGSSFSYGKRYATIALLNLRTRAPEDRDTDGHVVVDHVANGGEASEPEPTVNSSQLFALDKAIQLCGIKAAVFCDAYGISQTQDLPARMFDAAIKRCQDHAAKNNRK